MMSEKEDLHNVKAVLSWIGPTEYWGTFDLDLSALLLNSENKVTCQENFIYYGNLKSPCGSVVQSGDERNGKRSKTLTVSLDSLPKEVEHVLLTVSINGKYSEQIFHRVPDGGEVIFLNADTNEENYCIDLADLSDCRSAALWILHRTDSGWTLKTLCNDGQDSLENLVRQYGITQLAEPKSPLFEFWCRHCGEKLRTTENKIGSSGKCSKCQKTVIIERNSKPVIAPQETVKNKSETPVPPQVQLSPSGQKAGERLVIPMKDLQVPFRWCPAGTFTMGEDSNAHKVTLTRGFWLGETQVTREQWQAITGSKPPESPFAGAKLPVEGVSWDDCQDFVERLNAQNAAPAGFKFALPSEAQWEYACRAGSTTAYCFGDSESQLGDYAWYYNNSGSTTHPVGTKKSNTWGLYDMHGNVWEWCQDWYGSYNGDEVDPVGASSGRHRVCRGGSWDYDAERCRSAGRGNATPGNRLYYLGLRVALVSIR